MKNLWFKFTYLLFGHTEYLKLGGKLRSPKWSGVRNDFLKTHKECAVCGTENDLQVHHLKSFYEHPELELDENNLTTLCEGPGHACHLIFGHLGNFKSINGNAIIDIQIWRQKIKNRP